MKDIVIADRRIGRDAKPFIIAEMSGNHNQSLERAISIVEAAAEAGADALKIQTYTADTMTLDIHGQEDFVISDSASLWKGNHLYQLYQQAYTPWEWHKSIFERCHELGIIGFSTPFDASAVDFLETLDVPCYKIASFENIDLPLIQKVAATGKPIIMSTGMASLAELDDAVRTMREAGCSDIILLKCTSSYPATPENSNINTIPHMRDLFGCQVGLSDHTLGIGAAIASIALGSTVIEKHFTLARKDGGVDSAFSLEPEEFKWLVAEAENARLSLGRISYGLNESEMASRKYRRSIYVAQDIRAGEVFTKANIRCVRPGYGLPPKFYDIIIGRTAKTDLRKGTPLTWEYLG
ncbi:MAG TPA: pseudaminic acid synthase [Selenomonadales bacterium]|nr:pseudaminic acid synthase [Selenomonadales bacterium]